MKKKLGIVCFLSLFALLFAGCGELAELGIEDENGMENTLEGAVGAENSNIVQIKPLECSLQPGELSIPSVGGTYTISASCKGTPPPSSYVWVVNGELQSSYGSSLSYKFPINPTAHYKTYTIAVAAKNGYSSSGAQMTASQQPGMSQPPPKKPVCTLNPLTLTIPSSGGSYSFTASCSDYPTLYMWSVDGKLFLKNSSTFSYDFPTNNTTGPKTYTVIVSASNSAGSGSAQTTVLQSGKSLKP